MAFWQPNLKVNSNIERDAKDFEMKMSQVFTVFRNS